MFGLNARSATISIEKVVPDAEPAAGVLAEVAGVASPETGVAPDAPSFRVPSFGVVWRCGTGVPFVGGDIDARGWREHDGVSGDADWRVGAGGHLPAPDLGSRS